MKVLGLSIFGALLSGGIIGFVIANIVLPILEWLITTPLSFVGEDPSIVSRVLNPPDWAVFVVLAIAGAILAPALEYDKTVIIVIVIVVIIIMIIIPIIIIIKELTVAALIIAFLIIIIIIIIIRAFLKS